MRIVKIGGSGNGYSAMVVSTRPKLKSAVKGMIKTGCHAIVIKQTLRIKALTYRRIRAEIISDIQRLGCFA